MNKEHTTKAGNRARKRALEVEQRKLAKRLVADWRSAQSAGAGEDVVASSRKLRHRVNTWITRSELTEEERKVVEDAWAKNDEDRRARARAQAGRSAVEAWRKGQS